MQSSTPLASPPLRPIQHAVAYLVRAILEGPYRPGCALPGERDLAHQMGITRATLREAIQRLASEGWLTIRHGKATVVNDYWRQGGLRILATLARFPEHLPDAVVGHLLEVRRLLLPRLASQAAARQPEALQKILYEHEQLADRADAFADFDWRLQHRMVRCADNPVVTLMFNDFEALFKHMALRYFKIVNARRTTVKYYQQLAADLENGGLRIEAIVQRMMTQSIDLWEKGAACRQ